MNIINALKKYNVKSGELKRLTARLRTIDLKLDNWDKLQSSTISDMPIHHDTSSRDKIGKMVEDREMLREERLAIELSIADINSFIIDVDSKLDLLGYEHRWLLDKKYRQGYFYTYAESKQNKNFQALLRLYNKEIDIIEGSTLGRKIKQAEKAVEEL